MTPSRFLVGGSWRQSSRSVPVRNPFNGDVVGEVYQAGTEDIEDAISSAKSAFGLTRRLRSFERSEALLKIADGIRSRKEDFARLITSDTGKPISIARVEVDRSIFTFTTAAEEAKRIGGEQIPLDLAPHSKAGFGLTRRFPLGPIAAITPFNFPINLVAHKLGPAIAAGNSSVLKPASTGARVAILLGEIMDGAGLPPGTVNIVPCSGGEASQLVTDERLKLLSFTGSPDVGWAMKSKAGRKRVVLELGGNAAVVVDEGVDPAGIMGRLIQGSFANAGQSCIAIQRILIHESLKQMFLSGLLSAVSEIPVGDPFDDRTVVGPMVDEQSAKKVEGWLEEARSGGAKILCGGKRNGALLEPTVVVDVRSEMKVCAQEVFAPVVTVESFSTFDQAVGIVNNSRYGLQAGVFTNNLKNAMRAFEEFEVGGVILNDVPTFRIDHMPYGGIKESGFGREGIRYAIEEMTQLKLLVANY
jgi:glyceraldehyde-3-phosphate dehydrogenase (NADP+)